MSKCPRCDSDSIEIGEIQLQIGKTRKAPVSIKLCGKCMLVFYESVEKITSL